MNMNKKMMNVCIIVLTSFTLSVNGVGFQTLQEMQYYAKRMPEYPESDNTNWLQPDFSSFYTQKTNYWINSLLLFLRLKERPMWREFNFNP